MNLIKDDFTQLTARIQQDLRDAQTKLVELRAWLAQLDLPELEEDPVKKLDLMDRFLRNGAYQMTDTSIIAELQQRGIPDSEHDRFLDLAHALRGEAA